MLDLGVGEWQLIWEMQDGTTGKESNTITKILDGKVIQENFAATDAGTMTGFKGTSISIYNLINITWHQAWADNQGSYYDFSGSV